MGQECRPIAEAQASLQCIEGCFQERLVLKLRRLLRLSIDSQLFKLPLQMFQRAVTALVLQEGHFGTDPLEQVRGQPFVVLHQLLVLLIHFEHFADAVGGSFSLKAMRRDKTSNQPLLKAHRSDDIR